MKLPIGELWPKSLARWDAIVAAAEKAHIRFQFTLFHHGQFSSTTDSNWKENPWNASRGGFLNKPDDFFTDPKAKALAKVWLRYAVARWSYSPSIMAWELFNEVQWTDGARNIPITVGAWHDEMADYVRSLDPQHHLVTTSSELSLPIWRKMDYLSPHGYPARVEPMVMTTASPDDRPLFFGEIGPGSLNGGKDVQVLAVRDGIWSGLFALQAGSAEYWTWDLVLKDNLHREFAMAHKIFDASKILVEPGLKQMKLGLDAGVGANLVLTPGGGWAKFTQYDYHLPQDAGTAMGGFSTYFQGKGHPEMREHPVRFLFSNPVAGKFSISVSGVSDTGGELRIKVNGIEKIEQKWPAGTHLTTTQLVDVDIPAGDVAIELDNMGPDWVQIGSISVPGIAPNATGLGVGSSSVALMRIERPAGATRSSVLLSGLPLADGEANGVLTDLATGQETPVKLQVSGGTSSTRLEVPSDDAILWLRH